jgi:hypothetical protein
MHTGKVTIVSVAWQAHRATAGMVVETMIRKSTTATATGSSQGLADATSGPKVMKAPDRKSRGLGRARKSEPERCRLQRPFRWDWGLIATFRAECQRPRQRTGSSNWNMRGRHGVWRSTTSRSCSCGPLSDRCARCGAVQPVDSVARRRDMTVTGSAERLSVIGTDESGPV